MSGIGPTLYLPHGASATWLLAIAKPEDGSAVDLTLATAIEFLIKRTATTAAADAALTLDLAAGVTVIDAVAGLARSVLTAAQSAALENFGRYFYETRITFTDESVLIPDNLRGVLLLNLDSAEEQELDGADIKRLDAATGTLTPLTPDMSNYTINRHDLTGLTGGTSVKLDGLAAATLDALSDNTRLQLGFTGGIVAQYRLGAIAAGVESAPHLIVCDNDTERCWRLEFVMKEGQPAAWNADTSKFYRIWVTGADGAASTAPDDTGFSIPV